MPHDLSGPPLLACHNLAVARGGRRLIGGVGFSLLPGGLLVLSGGNGTGKTSLLRTLAGLLPAEEGAVRWRGEDIEESERFAGEMVYLGHRDGLKDEADVSGNLRFWAAMSGLPELLPAAMRFLGLEGLEQRPVRLLSAGQRRRVAMARLLLRPSASLWLLDEPASHLDEDGVRRLGGMIASRLNQGGAVVMSLHQRPPGLIDGLPTSFLDLADYRATG